MMCSNGMPTLDCGSYNYFNGTILVVIICDTWCVTNIDVSSTVYALNLSFLKSLLFSCNILGLKTSQLKGMEYEFEY